MIFSPQVTLLNEDSLMFVSKRERETDREKDRERERERTPADVAVATEES